MDKIYKNFIASKNNSFSILEFDYKLLSKYQLIIKDKLYFDFIIETSNGGFYFSNALQFYSYTQSHDFNNIEFINNLLLKEYENIFSGLVAIGQDIFANQFAFDVKTNEIVWFNIETAEKTIIANSFNKFLDELIKDLDYYTGSKFLLSNFGSIKFNERLCPKIPFVMGGEYSKQNLYTSSFPKYIESNANIARQVYNLKDGTNVKLVIDESKK